MKRIECGASLQLDGFLIWGLSKCRFGGHVSDLLHQNLWRAPGNIHFIKQARWLITILKFKNHRTESKLQTTGTLRGRDSVSGDRPCACIKLDRRLSDDCRGLKAHGQPTPHVRRPQSSGHNRVKSLMPLALVMLCFVLVDNRHILRLFLSLQKQRCLVSSERICIKVVSQALSWQSIG